MLLPQSDYAMLIETFAQTICIYENSNIKISWLLCVRALNRSI